MRLTHGSPSSPRWCRPGVELLQITLATVAGHRQWSVVMWQKLPFAQAGGQRRIEGLDGTPGTLEEVIAAGEDVAAGGHARRRADPVVVEHAGLTREGIEVGRLDIGRGVVARQDVSDRVLHERENGSHWDPFIWRAARYRRRTRSASAPWRAWIPGGRKGPRPVCGSRASIDRPWGGLADGEDLERREVVTDRGEHEEAKTIRPMMI